MNANEDISMQGPPRDGSDTRMVESWMRRDLAARFDGVLREQLPADMMALLSELA